MDSKTLVSEDCAPELRRTTLVPLISSALSMIISWVAVVLSYNSDICQSIYNWVERDLEAARYIFMFTGLVFTIAFIYSLHIWRKR